mmetsp:Transcript_33174/g.87748  ORF Transcript_33174/g.87748 Transcript_33174/m.87748 type:complete len:311 (-) Transcript_33174:431-1363(-)
MDTRGMTVFYSCEKEKQEMTHVRAEPITMLVADHAGGVRRSLRSTTAKCEMYVCATVSTSATASATVSEIVSVPAPSPASISGGMMTATERVVDMSGESAMLVTLPRLMSAAVLPMSENAVMPLTESEIMSRSGNVTGIATVIATAVVNVREMATTALEMTIESGPVRNTMQGSAMDFATALETCVVTAPEVKAHVQKHCRKNWVRSALRDLCGTLEAFEKTGAGPRADRRVASKSGLLLCWGIKLGNVRVIAAIVVARLLLRSEVFGGSLRRLRRGLDLHRRACQPWRRTPRTPLAATAQCCRMRCLWA